MTDEELTTLIHKAGLIAPDGPYTPDWLEDTAQELVSYSFHPPMVEADALAAIFQKLEALGTSITYKQARILLGLEETS